MASHPADVIIRTMATAFDQIHHREYAVITNGFDPEDMTGIMDSAPDKKFSIAHIGTLAGSRNPLVLWEALRSLIADDAHLSEDLEIKLVGKVDYTVMQSIDDYGLTRFVRKIDYLPHDEVTRCQRQSQVLLLIINNTPNAKMILTGKLATVLSEISR